MTKMIELSVPDLGGFEDVPIIEVLVASGETIGKDAPLVTLESDKATMEVPATAAGIVRDIKVKIGDRVSPGSILANLEIADDSGTPATPAPAATADAIASPPAVAASQRTTIATSARELIVPDLGGFDDVPVISVFVKAGDAIAVNAALVELESDKATMEVPALFAGTIGEVRVKVGDKVSPGTVLATVETASEPVAGSNERSVPASPASATPAKPSADQTAANRGADVTPPSPSTNGASNGVRPGVASGPFHASPAIRRFARELGVNVGSVSGSGPNGRITRDDVQEFIKHALRSGAPPPSATTGAPTGGGLQLLPWPKIDFEKFGPVERVPLSRIAKISGQNLARNWVLIPHVTHHEDADVTELEAFRVTINVDHKDVKVTMLALLLKALVTTLHKFPNFNSSLDADELIIKQYYHLGFAADTPSGLVVPVIRDVDKKGVLEIARETADLAKKARDGKLAPAQMSGSGFTVSSLGGIGGTGFTPIINAPEVAILGVSRTTMKPVWDGTAFKPRLILPLSLSYDHRVIDGAAAARFCAYLAGVLADIRKTLL